MGIVPGVQPMRSCRCIEVRGQAGRFTALLDPDVRAVANGKGGRGLMTGNEHPPCLEHNPAPVLPRDWYRYCLAPGVVDRLPGIYEWHIEGVGSYIGQYSRIGRPTKEYGRNVARILNGTTYHVKGRDFRCIHHALHVAHRDGRQITLTILENVVPKIERNHRERELIAERGTLNRPRYSRGGPTPTAVKKGMTNE